jgi:hypothetical protein
VVVSHVDLPGSDWGSLFDLLDSSDSYMRPEVSGVPRDSVHAFGVGVGRSFYKRLLPDTSVDLAFRHAHHHVVGLQRQLWRLLAPGSLGKHKVGLACAMMH